MYDLWNANGKCPPELMAQAEWVAPQLEFSGLAGATAGIESANLSWPAATGGTPPVTYRIYQATETGGQDFGAPVLSTGNLGAAVGSLYPGSTAPLTYFFVVRAADSGGGTEVNTVELAVQPLLDPAKDQDRDGMSNGAEQQYGMLPFDNSDALADTDDDGMNNLTEIALGSDPTETADSNWPLGKQVESEGLDYFAVRYVRLKNNPSAEIVAEISGTLGVWNSGPAHTAIHEVIDHLDGTETVTERMTEPMNVSQSGFMRLKIVPK
jgi:hypothetical protein